MICMKYTCKCSYQNKSCIHPLYGRIFSIYAYATLVMLGESQICLHQNQSLTYAKQIPMRWKANWTFENMVRNGADVRGYLVWSLLDNFEWTSGFTIRFGLYRVDYTTLKRIQRLSATWYKQFILNHKVQASSTSAW